MSQEEASHTFLSSPFSVDAQWLPLEFLLPTARTSTVLKREFLFSHCPHVCLVPFLVSAMGSLPSHGLTDQRIFLFFFINPGTGKNGCMTFTFSKAGCLMRTKPLVKSGTWAMFL